MIAGFHQEYRFLSNFWYVTVVYDNKIYRSVEHAYQAAKTLDYNARAIIRSKKTPSEAKREGNKKTLREDWESIKQDIMLDLLRQKFTDKNLRKQLLDTGDQELIELNYWHDTFWGQCDCVTHNGAGENNLGKLLMQVRKEIQTNE